MKKLVLIALTLTMTAIIRAEVILPVIIDSKMVLQRNVKAPIWGWADKGEEVTVEFAGQIKKAMPTGKKNRWMVKLDPLKASSEPRVMTIKGKNEIKLDNILVGEVWLAAGQSNMEINIVQLTGKEQVSIYAEKNNKLFRMFCVADHISSPVPLDDTRGDWSTCSEMINEWRVKRTNRAYYKYSAVGCFFGLKLQKELGIPVAVIDTSWSGRKIEPFIPDEGYEITEMKYQKFKKEYYPKVMDNQKKHLPLADKFISTTGKGLFVPFPAFKPWGMARNFLYNGMIAPLTPFAIKGAIWYQGEANRGSKDYFEKLKALSAGWSKVFNVKEIPIYQVQIAPYIGYRRKTKKDETILCDSIWEAQYKAAKEIPGMEVVAIHDTIPSVKNIHPIYKKPVGERLAAMALNKNYGKKIPFTGPTFAGAKANGNNAVISFEGIDKGLETNDGKAVNWFELSDDGVKFIMGEAVIKDNKVIVTATGIISPKFVRMGWSELAIPNLCDKNGWPVFAFSSKKIK